MGCGLSWSTLGSTHHTTEDISALKAIPNLTILSPASPKEVEKCVEVAYKINGPVYIRMGMSNEPEIYDDECNFELQKNSVIKEGLNATVFVTGSIISNVILAREKLALEGINIKIVNVSTIKPFDNLSIIEESQKQSRLFSVEEHNVIGGIGSSIADVIAINGLQCKLTKIGLNDCFAHGYGTYEEIRKANNLDVDSIYKIIKDNIK
jgi:transketolase